MIRINDVFIPVSPAGIADRLRKVANDLTNENRHTDAMICNQAVEVLLVLMPQNIPEV
jgi:hypothetical protein